MAEKTKVNTGSKTYELEFEDLKKSVVIRFNPRDPGLPVRLSELRKMLSEKVSKIKGCETDENGNPTDEEAARYYRDANKALCTALDEAFKSNISDNVFKYCDALTMIGGNSFLSIFLSAVVPVIEAEQESVKNEYLEKYRK